MAQSYQDHVMLGEGLSAGPKPLEEPTRSSPHVLVLGGGVTALTTAWCLLDRGVHVTILSKEWPSWTDKARLSSQAAGALWKCLPLECGPQAVLDNLSTSQQWTLESYKLYSAMASIPEVKKIVELRPCTIVTTGDIEGNIIYKSKLRWLQENNIPGFKRSTDLFDEYGLNTKHSGGLTEAYEYTAPVIDVDLAMGFLLDLVKSKGAVLYTKTIIGDLLDQEYELLKTCNADAIINAIGLGAREAAVDPNVYGLHGALLRLVNNGTDFPVVENAIIVSSVKAGASGGEGAFILPRQDKILALGTISQSKGEAADLTVDSKEVREMRARCEDLLPYLKNARLNKSYPILNGTRPQMRDINSPHLLLLLKFYQKKLKRGFISLSLPLRPLPRSSRPSIRLPVT